MASTISYTFDLSSDKKVLKFKGECGEEYILIHELSWTIYGNSILNMNVECNIDKSVLIVAELYSDNANVVKASALLVDCGADLNFQNVNFLMSDSWKCVIRVIPVLRLHALEESSPPLPSAKPVKKGLIKKTNVEQLSSDLQHILNTGDFSDVVLSDGVSKINVHKLMLSARSPVFAKMFQHPMKENHENCVTISDIPIEVLKELVCFIYSGTVTVKDAKMARNLYIAADKYAVTDLKKLCSEVLQNVSIDDCLDALTLADLHEDKSLKQCVLDFIAKNYSKVKSSKNWEIFVKENKTLTVEILSFILENIA